MLEKQNKYSIRKLTVGAASVLIGASFFAVNGKTVKADAVNDTNNVDSNKVVQESTGEKAPESTQDSLLKGTDKIEKNSSVENSANANFTANGDTKDMVATFRCHYNSATGSGGASYISAANFAIMPTDSTSLTLPKIADSVQVPQSKNVQKEDDVIQRTVKPHAAILKQELDSLVKTAALPSVKLNKQNLKELKQIFVNNNPKDLRSISWKLQDSALSLSTPLYTLSNSSNSIMLPHLTGYKFKLIKRGTGANSVSFAYSKEKNYKYVFNIAFKDNVMYFTVLTPNKAHNKLTVKQVYKVHNQKELANILSLYL